MAIVVPEIAETAATAGETAVGAGGAEGASRVRPGSGRTRAAALPQRQGGQQRRQQGRSRARRVGRAKLPGAHSYQPVILAEFLVAIVIVAVSPIAKGGSTASKAKGSPSPYSVNTLKQLIAIGGVYFVLGLLAASKRAGRYSAWFGALVLVGLGLAELANGDLTAFFKIFGPAAAATAAAPAAAPNLQDSGAASTTTPGATDPTAIFPTVGPSGVTPAAPNLTDSGQQTITQVGPSVYVSNTGSGQPGPA